MTVAGTGRSLKRAITLLVALAIATIVLLALPSLAFGMFAQQPDRSVQTDGRVSDVLVVGDRIYLAGTFLNVNGQSRTRLAAIDANTGQLTSWAPAANGWVKTLAASGGKIYAGGEFTRVDGIPRARLVALNASTGAVDEQFNPGANATVNTLATANDRLYVGGRFSNVGGQQRSRLAAVDGETGGLILEWNSAASGAVRTLAFSPDKKRLYVGGQFGKVSGKVRRGLAALVPETGTVLKWRPDPGRPVIDLVASTRRVFTAEGGSGGGKVASYGTRKGKRLWGLKGDGDAQAVALSGGKVYVGGHFTKLGGKYRAYFAAVGAKKGRIASKWAPRGKGGGVWTIAPDPSRKRIYAGGDFTSINDKPHRYFTRFSE